MHAEDLDLNFSVWFAAGAKAAQKKPNFTDDFIREQLFILLGQQPQEAFSSEIVTFLTTRKETILGKHLYAVTTMLWPFDILKPEESYIFKNLQDRYISLADAYCLNHCIQSLENVALSTMKTILDAGGKPFTLNFNSEGQVITESLLSMTPAHTKVDGVRIIQWIVDRITLIKAYGDNPMAIQMIKALQQLKSAITTGVPLYEHYARDIETMFDRDVRI